MVIKSVKNELSASDCVKTSATDRKKAEKTSQKFRECFPSLTNELSSLPHQEAIVRFYWITTLLGYFLDISYIKGNAEIGQN